MKQINYKKTLWWLIVISTVVRAITAALVELGNDEVYYRLYALYPDWSHFDHPFMVGAVIEFFSMNLHLNSEFFLRLGSIVLGAADIWIIFTIGKTIKNERTGLIAAMLFVASIYASVIVGVFILPDTPQLFFWLISLLLMVKTLPADPKEQTAKRRMLWLGFVIGLAILSKYTSLFLWGGAGLFILIFNRRWFKSSRFYLAVLITAITILPIVIWNFQNDFISFTFHGERVAIIGHSVQWDYFFTELLGEFAYNNPINFFLIWIAVIALFFKRIGISNRTYWVIVSVGLPLIITFLLFALFRRTLPHWTAPGYTTLIVLAAAWLDERFSKRAVPRVVVISMILTALVIILGFVEINCGVVKPDNNNAYEKLGEDDITLDMYGYKQIGDAFTKLVRQDIKSGEMPADAVMVGNKWFPLANLDYYCAAPLNMEVYGIGTLDRIHKYAWINRVHGGFQKGMSAYYITTSRQYTPPKPFFNDYFYLIEPADTIQVVRCGDTVERAFVYRLKNMIRLPEDVLSTIEK